MSLLEDTHIYNYKIICLMLQVNEYTDIKEGEQNRMFTILWERF